MSHFFAVYKQLEGKETAVNDVKNAKEAKRIINNAIDGYIESYCK